MHCVYVCDYGLLFIWQINKGMDYWGNWSQLCNKMNNVVYCSSINDLCIGFISLCINYLCSKDGMRMIRGNPYRIAWKIRWSRGRMMWNGRVRCGNNSSTLSLWQSEHHCLIQQPYSTFEISETTHLKNSMK